MKYIDGNLVTQRAEFDVIAHGCNCFCNMRKGIALEIKNIYPEVYEADCKTTKGDKSKLGTYTKYIDEKLDLTILNLYTQYRYGGLRRGVINADYDAIRKSMKLIKDNYSGKKIGLPKIGAGYAGGKWNIIEKIIKEELDGEDVTIVNFKK